MDFNVTASDDENEMTGLSETFELFGMDFVRSILEIVTSNSNGRVSYDLVAEGIKESTYCPEFTSSGHSALKFFMREHAALLEKVDLWFDNDTQEFFFDG